jgi:hypothetical protein
VGTQPPHEGSAYDAALAGRREATFFHTRVWARIVTAAFPELRDRSTVLVVDGQPHAVPLFRWRRLGGLLGTRHSSFPFLYGGPVPARPAAFAALLRRMARGGESVVLIGNPFAGPTVCGAAELAPPERGRPWRPAAETTHLLTLPRTPEVYWETVLSSRKRNDIRRLAQKGVAVELSRDPADVARVDELYRRRMAAWSRRPGLVYPAAFYRALLELGGEAVRLYVARHAGRVIGGAFVVRWNGLVHYNAGYFDDEARALRPNVLIQERVIRDAIADGFHTYDMLPSAGLRSVEEFKESFGGVRTAFPRWERAGWRHRLAAALRPTGAAAKETDDDGA